MYMRYDTTCMIRVDMMWVNCVQGKNSIFSDIEGVGDALKGFYDMFI